MKTEQIKPHQPPQMTWGAVSLTLLICILWGGNPVAVQFAADSMPPLAVATLRFALATLFMLGWCRLGRHPLALTRKQIPYVVGGGLLLFGQIGLFHLGIDQSSSSHATLLINTYVFWVMTFECYLLRTATLSRWKILGLILAAIGTALIILTNLKPTSASQDAPTLWGDGLLFLSGIVLALKILITKVSVREMKSATVIFWHDFIALGCLLIFSLLFEEWPAWEIFDWVTCSSLVYQGLCVAGFCFGTQAYLLQKYSATSVSIYSFSSPLFGVLLGIAIRGDDFTIWFALAALLVAGGIYLVNRPTATK